MCRFMGVFMQYSEDFKQKVLSTFGYNEGLKSMLDEGHEFIGQYLHDIGAMRIPSEEIVAAYEGSNFQEIYQKAKRLATIHELYLEWKKQYRSQHQKTKKFNH